MRGKLLIPEGKVKFVDENSVKNLKDKVVQLLTVFAELSCEICKYKGIDVYADLLSFIFKAPMLLSHAPAIGGKYLSTAYEYFFTYVVTRHCEDYSFKQIDELMEKLEENRKSLSRITQYISSLRDIYEALLYTPADTRPGFNITSLASHLELTSIVLWLSQPYSVDLNYLRVSALLHDIGKLFDPTEHVKQSAEILDEVLKNLPDDNCVKEDLKNVKRLVEQHHFDNILADADRLASATDRLSNLVFQGLDKYNPSVKECYKMTAKDGIKCLEEKLGKDGYEKLSILLFKYLLSVLVPPSDTPPYDIFKVEKTNVSLQKPTLGKPLGYLVYTDFPGIQKFISSFPQLRDMAFASLLVDFLTTVATFIVLDQKFYKKTGNKSRLPAEALLSGYGGHSYIVVRSELSPNDIKDAVKDLGKEFDISLKSYVVEFVYENYIKNFKEVSEEIMKQTRERYIVDLNEKVYSLGLHRVCTSCGIRPASHIDVEDELCDRCYKVRQLSKSRAFISRANTTYLVGQIDITPLDFMKKAKLYENETYYAMEFIAGYRNLEDTTYVAFIKADGNYGGEIFKYSITFSDYIDRSFRLDYGVKKAFYDTIVELANQGNNLNKLENPYYDLASRILAGVLYIGGDDILMLAPAVIALPFAVKMFKRAEENTGFTFKVGVLVTKPDHPVQFAIRAVDELMEEAKIDAKALKTNPLSSISCLTFESSLATDGAIRRIIDEEKNFLLVKNKLQDVEEILKITGYIDFSFPVSLYNNKNDGKKKTREILHYIDYIVQYALQENEFLSTLAYILRYRFRVEDPKEKEFLTFLLRKYGENDSLSSASAYYKDRLPLLDYFFMLKTFRLGVGT
ncbi:HD domain-containing protein [Sulfurisphaera javensis]|uniref:HD domain-containing protein n=1 Tax=Sulfurisphaera javensis TaxID=2049879 RepID=A0AAT9GVL7_9CREN